VSNDKYLIKQATNLAGLWCRVVW